MRPFPIRLICAILPAVLICGACAAPSRGPVSLGDIDQALMPGPERPASAKAAAAPSVPAEIAAALLPPLSLGIDPGIASRGEPRFDVAARNTSAREFFMGLVEGTSYNMVVHPEVAGEISLALKNATVPEVMEVVRNVYGYEFRRSESGYQVLPAGLQSRIFQVNYLNLTRRGVSQTRVSSGQVTESGDKNSSSTGRETRGGTQQAVSGSRIDTESTADFWPGLETALRALVGSEGGRRVVVQPQANVVVVRAFPEELREVEGYLAALQGNLQRQVILEAKIVEVELSDGFQTGINWALLARMGEGKTAVFGQTGGGTIFSRGTSEIAGNAGVLNPLNLLPVEGTATSAFGGVFSAALNIKDFTAFIEMLETQGQVQVLSSPRIATINNQKAVIKVGSDEFFVTDISTDTVTGTAATTSTDVTLTPFFSGIALDVTPQIDHDGRVTLHIHPTVSEVTDQTKIISTGGDREDLRLPLAFSTIRETDSIINAESGQVVVIGGLMETRTVNREAGVPVLGRLPFLGHLFRHTQSSTRKSELVILLRPVVVQGGAAWNAELEQSRQRVERMGGSMGGGR